MVEIPNSGQVGWIEPPISIFGPQDTPHTAVLHLLMGGGSVQSIRASQIDNLMPALGTPNGCENVNLGL